MGHLIRVKTISLEQGLNLIKSKPHFYSSRLLNYIYNGTTCKKCGLEGSFWSYDRFQGNLSKKTHLNLWAINKFGNEILMTRDHIIPKSKGGSDCPITNSQTLCCKCNNKKADKIEL